MNTETESDLQIDENIRQIHFAVKDGIGLAWVADRKQTRPGTKHIFSPDVKNILFGNWRKVIYQKMNGDTVSRVLVVVADTITYLEEWPEN